MRAQTSAPSASVCCDRDRRGSETARQAGSEDVRTGSVLFRTSNLAFNELQMVDVVRQPRNS